MVNFIHYIIQKGKKDINRASRVLYQRHRNLAFKEAVSAAPPGESKIYIFLSQIMLQRKDYLIFKEQCGNV